MADAVVIGAGHNGLVAANLLADAGWQVQVLEATDQPGGSVRTAELTAPGFHCDVFSAFYALGAASPVLHRLHLGDYGLEWVHAPLVVAHPHADGRCAVLSRDLAETAASLEAFAPGDGAAWERLYGRWRRIRGPLLQGLFSMFPPVRAALGLAARLPPRELLRLARFALLPVRRLAEEEFAGAGGGLLLGGNALHADLGPEAPGSGFLGWLLCSLGQELGYPAVKGGAGQLTRALVRRLESQGGRVVCNAPVSALEIRGRRAVAVRTADGQAVPAGRAVVGAVDAVTLYRRLIGEEHLPPSVVDDLRRFQFDHATVKVDWALDGGVPWTAEPARRAGTVHLADSMDELTMYHAQLACGAIPAKPLVVVGQMTTTDPSRSPSGTEALWAYAHVPQRVRSDAGGSITGAWTPAEVQAFADRIQARIEASAPGFGGRILARHVLGPPAMQQRNPSLVGGAVNAGTAQLYQQLVLRPTPGLGRPSTPSRTCTWRRGRPTPAAESTAPPAPTRPPWPSAVTAAAAGPAQPAADRRPRDRHRIRPTMPRKCRGRTGPGHRWWTPPTSAAGPTRARPMEGFGMRVFVTGGTGAIGGHVIPALVQQGHAVSALARTPDKAATLAAQGATPVVGLSLFDPPALAAAFTGHHAVVNLATAIPPMRRWMSAKAWRNNDRVRTQGSAAVVAAALAAGVGRLVQESVSMLYRDRGANWVDEDAPIDRYPMARGNLAAEANAHRFAKAGGTRLVLRLGWFYGPGAAHSEQLLALARRHLGLVLGPPDGYVSSIHVADAAAAVAAALHAPAGTFNIVDDQPLTKGAYAEALARAAGTAMWLRGPGRAALVFGDRLTSLTRSLRVSNARFRAATGWAPRYPSAREGWIATATALEHRRIAA